MPFRSLYIPEYAKFGCDLENGKIIPKLIKLSKQTSPVVPDEKRILIGERIGRLLNSKISNGPAYIFCYT